MKKYIKKIFSVLILFSFLFSSINFVVAEGEENSTEENVDYSIPTIANDPRVRLLTDSDREKRRKKKIEVKVDNWPHKHRLGTGSLAPILHKPAWMYLADSRIDCEESGSVYFIVNERGEKIRKIAINCRIVFEDKEKEEELKEEVLKDIKKEDEKTQDTSKKDNRDDTSDEDVENFVKDILGVNTIPELKEIKLQNKVFAISSKEMKSSVKSYSINKEKLYIGEYTEINGLKNKDYYNGLLAEIFSKFSKKVEINKFKNNFAKQLSQLSFSLNSYQDEKLDYKTRDFFRKKFVNDLKKIQVSYIKMQKQEERLKRFFFKK